MGTSTQTQDNSYRFREPCVTSAGDDTGNRLEAVLRELNLTLPRDWADRVKALEEGLERFTVNGLAWFSEDPLKLRLLKLHLAFTMFVPAGRADRARHAVMVLYGSGILHDDQSKADAGDLTDAIYVLIKGDVRFPKQKAYRLANALIRWDRIVKKAQDILMLPKPDAREQLQRAVDGFGPKAAAHFMRNTGLMRSYSALPIIDTHIIKMIDGLGFAIDPNRDKYKQYEQHFAALSRLLGLSPLLLDAVVWCAYAGNWDTSKSDFDNFKDIIDETDNRKQKT